jgi:integrase
MLRGGWSDSMHERLTVQEWGDRWFAAAQPHLKRTTVAHYASLFRVSIYPTLGGRPLRELRPIDVGEWMTGLTDKGNSPSWVRKAYLLLSQVMNSAVDNELIQSSPCRGHRLPRLPEPEPRILTVGEVERLVASSQGQAALMVRVLAYSGMRIGEVLSLRRDDVSADGRVVRVDERQAEIGGRLDYDVPKNHQKRPVTLPAFVAEALAEHVAAHVGPGPDSLLWTGRTGQALRYGSWRRWKWLPAVAAAGLDGLTPHDLRATHGSWVAAAHGVVAAAERLGHSNANVLTRHYARVVAGNDGRIVAGLEDGYMTFLEARGGHDDQAEGSGGGAEKGPHGL